MGEFRVHTFMVLVFIGVCGVLMLHDADGFVSMEVCDVKEIRGRELRT